MFFVETGNGRDDDNIDGKPVIGWCLHLFLPYNPKAMYISPLAFKVLMSVSSKSIPYSDPSTFREQNECFANTVFFSTATR